MYFRKTFLSLTILSILCVGFCVLVPQVKAATIDEIKQDIVKIQAQIAELQKQLLLTTTNNSTPTTATLSVPDNWCYTFIKSKIKYKDHGDAVGALQIALQKEGLFSGKVTSYFGIVTMNAVKAFQEKYASEILTPLKLSKGTGNVGTGTIAKLNQLYGCSALTPTPNSTPSCQDLWWYDNSALTCQQKQFCGSYMYLGLQAFSTEEECENSFKNDSAALCPAVCVQLWEIENGSCVLHSCESGCLTADNKTSFNNEAGCKASLSGQTVISTQTVTPVQPPSVDLQALYKVYKQAQKKYPWVNWNLYVTAVKRVKGINNTEQAKILSDIATQYGTYYNNAYEGFLKQANGYLNDKVDPMNDAAKLLQFKMQYAINAAGGAEAWAIRQVLSLIPEPGFGLLKGKDLIGVVESSPSGAHVDMSTWNEIGHNDALANIYQSQYGVVRPQVDSSKYDAVFQELKASSSAFDWDTIRSNLQKYGVEYKIEDIAKTYKGSNPDNRIAEIDAKLAQDLDRAHKATMPGLGDNPDLIKFEADLSKSLAYMPPMLYLTKQEYNLLNGLRMGANYSAVTDGQLPIASNADIQRYLNMAPASGGGNSDKTGLAMQYTQGTGFFLQESPGALPAGSVSAGADSTPSLSQIGSIFSNTGGGSVGN